MYMAALPEEAEGAAGEEPEVPERTITDEAGAAQMGGLAVAVRVGVAVRAGEIEGVPERVGAAVGLGVSADEGVRVGGAVAAGVRDVEPLGVDTRDDVPLGEDAGVSVVVGTAEPEVEALGVPVALDEPVPLSVLIDEEEAV